MQHRNALQTAHRIALDYIEGLDQSPVLATASLSELKGRFSMPLPESGMDAATVIEELAGQAQGGVLGSSGGRFFGWVIGGNVPSSLAADWLTSTWDQAAVMYATGPAAAVVEEVCGDWLKQLLGLPQKASFALVTGCQMAHVTCFLAARHRVLANLGWDVERQGLSGAPGIQVLATNLHHGSIERAVKMVGLGLDNLHTLPAESLVDAVSGPTIVVLQAGDINSGLFDDLERWIPQLQARGAWVHIDGAFGLWAQATNRYKHLAKGVELADSWATDGHKWLNVPYDCGYAFVRDSEAHRASLSHRASYLSHADDARDQIDWNPDWSRRARGFSTYAAIRELGREGIAQMLERCCDMAQLIVSEASKLEGVEVLAAPVLNQGMLAFGEDSRTEAVIAHVVASGEAFVTGTTHEGRRAMRLSVCNWQTTRRDAERCVAAIAAALTSV
ncbi:MAG: aspartate aminotransferase family protein [Acidobacteria bacterium]|nr:aspartate aminotransferase family protein [Acidobacteriota bacterium]